MKSAISQSHSNVVVFISDNASTDDTEPYCLAMASSNGKVKYHRHAQDVGAAGNFQFLLDNAKGDFLVFLADDDWMDSEYIEKCVGVLTGDSRFSLVGGSTRYYRNGQLEFAEIPVDIRDSNPYSRVDSYYRQVCGNGIFYGVMRRVHVSGWKIHSGFGGDWVWVSQLAWLGKVATLREVVIHRSLDGASSDLAALAVKLGCWKWLANYWELFLIWSIWRQTLTGFCHDSKKNRHLSRSVGWMVVMRLLHKTFVPKLRKWVGRLARLVLPKNQIARMPAN